MKLKAPKGKKNRIPAPPVLQPPHAKEDGVGVRRPGRPPPPLKWWGPKLSKLMGELWARPDNDEDVVVIVTGAEGSGKSSLACHLLSWLDPSFGLPRITVEGSEFIRLGKTMPSGRGRLWDEAKGGGFTRQSLSGENIAVAEHLFEARILHHFSFVLWPNIRWMETVISEHRALYWILVDARGHAIMHKAVRADYKGAKPRWRKLFTFDFPPFLAEWWPEYLKVKEARVRAFDADDATVGTILPEVLKDEGKVWGRLGVPGHFGFGPRPGEA